MKQTSYPPILLVVFVALLLVIPVVLVPLSSVQAQNNQMCIPKIVGSAVKPVIDGIVEDYGPSHKSDPGWANAAKFNLSADMGVAKSAEFLIGRTATDLYMAFEVDTPPPGQDNIIVLALSTTNNAAEDWRIHITPFDRGMRDGSDQPPYTVNYWRNSDPASGWNSAAPNPPEVAASQDFWLYDNIKYSKNGSRWAIEIKIPIETSITNAASNNKIYFPPATGNPSDNFKLYANVITTSSGTVEGLNPPFYQDPWPAGVIIVPAAVSFLERSTPAKAIWGTASFGVRDACKGVSLAQSNIGVKNPSNSSAITQNIRRYEPPGGFSETIDQCNMLPDAYRWPGTKGPLNTFVARPLNEGIVGGASVSAKFSIANWGIPGPNDWHHIWRPVGEVAGGLGLTPPTTDPPDATSTEHNIPDGGYGDLTVTWNLSYKQSCLYSKAHTQHQCILVDLDSTDPNVRFLNKSVQRNMDFVSASVFSRDAEISAKGYGAPPAGRSKHQFLIDVDTGIQKYYRKKGYYLTTQNVGRRLSADTGRIPVDTFPDNVTEAMTWIARGYLRTGNNLIINGREYEYAKYIGGYGVVAAHAGAVNSWTHSLSGDGLKKIGSSNNLYALEIAPGEAATVTTRIEAKEPCRCGDFKCYFASDFGQTAAAGSVAVIGIVVLGFGTRRRRRKKGDRA